MPADRDAALTDDAVLGGRLRLWQPRCGHRIGHDAILLAAAAEPEPGDHVVDLGAGVGAAGLALAARQPGINLTLLEVDRELAALASENAARNGLAERVRAVTLSVDAPPRGFSADGLAEATAAGVLMNPPFNDGGRGNPSPDARRRLAHSGGPPLAVWIRTAARLLSPGGVLTLIWRADGLPQVLASLSGFGSIAVLPVHPRLDAPAIRILVAAKKGSRAPLTLLPGLMLNDAAGQPTPAAEQILRHATPLSLGVSTHVR
jgi:tRNA1(Val) A37 N6-methylase TrmN6